MTGGGLEISQPELSGEQAPKPEDVHQVLDRLRSRIEEVAAWAEHASFPGANQTAAEDREQARVSSEEPEVQSEEESDEAHGGNETSGGDDAQGGLDEAPEPAPLDFLRTLARSGAVAGGVFSTGTQIIDLTESANAAQVPESGLLALLNLVPSDTVLEVRTSKSELRAARLGDDAFAVEVVPGSESEIDDWLASMLPSSGT
jgi:hypothetical protein